MTKSGKLWIIRAGHHRGLGASGGDQKHRVIGRSVAVNGNGIKAVIGGGGQELLQQLSWQGRIGGDIGQHSRHIRRDHARPFGDAANIDSDAVNVTADMRAFWECVRCQNRPGGLVPTGILIRNKLGKIGREFGGLKRLADDPG